MKRIITAIHVDSNPISLEMFNLIAVQIPVLHVKKSFLDKKDAFEYLVRNEVDIVFSDIEKHIDNSFWLSLSIKQQANIVFVTAHAEYAINAFEVCAFDFLLKPVQLERLEQVILRIEQKIENYHFQRNIKGLIRNYVNSVPYPTKIFIQNTGQLHIVILDDVIYFSASGAYTKIHFKSGEELLSSKMIKTYVDLLQEHPNFIRIHRSFFVNKQYVKILGKDAGQFLLTMSNGHLLEVSQRRKDEIFKDILK